MLTQPFVQAQLHPLCLKKLPVQKVELGIGPFRAYCLLAWRLFHNSVVIQLVDNPPPAGSMIRRRARTGALTLPTITMKYTTCITSPVCKYTSIYETSIHKFTQLYKNTSIQLHLVDNPAAGSMIRG